MNKHISMVLFLFLFCDGSSALFNYWKQVCVHFFNTDAFILTCETPKLSFYTACTQSDTLSGPLIRCYNKKHCIPSPKLTFFN
jgi:hypothetical protein